MVIVFRTSCISSGWVKYSYNSSLPNVFSIARTIPASLDLCNSSEVFPAQTLVNNKHRFQLVRGLGLWILTICGSMGL